MAFTYLPVTSDRGVEFFASNHKCNIAKAIIAHSPDLEKANNTFWRRGYPLQLRKRFLKTFGKYVNDPTMANVLESPEFEYEVDSWWRELEDVSDLSLESIIGGTPTPPQPIVPIIITLNTKAIHTGDSVAVTITGGGGLYEAKVWNGTTLADSVSIPDGDHSYVYTAEAADGTGMFTVEISDRNRPSNKASDTFDVSVVPSTFTNFIAFRTAADTGTVPATTPPFTYVDEGHQIVDIAWHDAPLQIRGGNYVKGSTTEVADGMKGTTYSMSDTSIVSVIHDTTDESLFTIDGSKAGSTVFTVLSADGKAKGEIVFKVTGTGP